MDFKTFVDVFSISALSGFGLSAFFGMLGWFIRGLLITVFDYRP